MKNYQFIILLVLMILSLGISAFSLFSVKETISGIKIPECKCSSTGNFPIEDQEFKRLMYTIEEDAHFCRAEIHDHRERWENRTKDFTRLYLNTNY